MKQHHKTFRLLYILFCLVGVLPSRGLLLGRHSQRRKNKGRRSPLWHKAVPKEGGESKEWMIPVPELTVTQALQRRYACKALARYDNQTHVETASPANPTVVQQAAECLNWARLSPSAFNTQPYRVMLVYSAAQNAALSRYCLGPNARRVLDADCTAVFCADTQILRQLLRWPKLRRSKDPSSDASPHHKSRQGPPVDGQNLFCIALFSSGYPFLPRMLAALLGFLVRTAVSCVDLVTRPLANYPMPTLTSRETWSTKQTMMVAMSYMLACTARFQLATIPMEGLNVRGLRRALGIPSRHTIPLIVATGRPQQAPPPATTDTNNTALVEQRRYPGAQVLFGDQWSQALPSASSDSTCPL